MWKQLTYAGPSLAVLHAAYAKQHRIDNRAPLHGRETMEVSAPASVVWRRLSDVPAWNANLEPGVKDVDLPDGVRVDAPFARTAGGVRMRARFAVVDPEHELAWTGVALGLKVAHRFVLEPCGEGGTRVVVEESMAGPPLAALVTTVKLRSLLRRSLQTLKGASEQTTS
jgi:hypothetical protein